jgi:glutaredoxin
MSKNVAFYDESIDDNPVAAQRMVEVSKRRTVPQVRHCFVLWLVCVYACVSSSVGRCIPRVGDEWCGVPYGVPLGQIFINGRHIGGNSELQALNGAARRCCLYTGRQCRVMWRSAAVVCPACSVQGA